ncbi:SIS domain-containing protein [Streptomyces sp. NPDC056161]|uniref:SIS domain-containing protein n=1 Tax=Streptomyces sp. NPDC056161 TaxID=3345732 RepID=UPI0035D5BA46
MSSTILRDQALDLVNGLDLDAVRGACALLDEVRNRHGVVLTAGNGGSSSTASHFAADLAKFTRQPRQPSFRALSLTDNVACHTAWTNDDDPSLALRHLAEPWLPSGPDTRDAVVLFSVHGGSLDGDVSNNLVELARHARERGAFVIGVTGFDGGALAALSDVHINTPLFEEPYATPAVESVHVLLAHAICLELSGKTVQQR